MMLKTAVAVLLSCWGAIGLAQQLQTDPGTYGPPLEIVHLYKDQFPTGFAISSTGRMFSTYPGSLYAKNTGNYTLAELTDRTSERPYPNVGINTPPAGKVNQSTTPPSAVNYHDYLISAQGLVIDAKDRMWVLDNGRVIDSSGIQAPASVGGPKIVGIDLKNDKVFKTITFPDDVAYSTSYLNDLRIDLRPSVTTSGEGILYITDSSSTGQNGIITVDLGSGTSWRHLDGDPRVGPAQQYFLSIWGEPVYFLPGPGKPYMSDPTGADGIALSADGETLFWSITGGRNLYSIPTLRLRDKALNSEVRARAAVQAHGEKGVSDGIDADSNDRIYCGSFENNAINVYDPEEATVSTYVRDPRIAWTDAVLAARDGYLYFNENQLWRTPGYWPNGEDRTVKPFPLFRVPLKDGARSAAPQ